MHFFAFFLSFRRAAQRLRATSPVWTHQGFCVGRELLTGQGLTFGTRDDADDGWRKCVSGARGRAFM